MITDTQKKIIKRCQKSVVFFLRNFGKTKHPAAGIIPFNPFTYQRKALAAFRQNRFNIFRKCRQSGASKISGAFALWFALFHNHKTILIVSRTDEDAKNFLAENISFLFRHLPEWMQQLWEPTKDNEHEIHFPNGSKIKSLTSHPDVLRSNASSLNIIDEAAFIDNMSVMWAGGFSTLQHGGSVVVISTTNGIGEWYWSTWVDAEAGLNPFNPIMINWWDMDWRIEYRDELSGQMRSIAPTDGIRKCTDPEDIEKYGPYWSPWLEEQYRGLQERGEAWKFKQEVLADFVGSGNTILDPRVLAYLTTTVTDDYQCVAGEQTYTHPVSGDHSTINFNGDKFRSLDKDEGLWVWKLPNYGRKPETHNGRMIDAGEPPHRYSAGIDIATGKGRDYFAMEVFDIDEMEQVAEIMIRTIPRFFKFIVDYIGRWYNNALLVVERNNGGDAFIDDLRMELMYPNIWRKTSTNDKPSISKRRNPMRVAEYGFFTSGAGKPKLNKALIDNIRPDESGFKIYSRRLVKQCHIYVRKKDRTGRDTEKTEAEDGPGNYDDLVIATGLSFLGVPDAVQLANAALIPHKEDSELSFKPTMGAVVTEADQIVVASGSADPGLLVPIVGVHDMPRDQSIEAELMAFTSQIGALPVAQNIPSVSARRHTYGEK